MIREEICKENTIVDENGKKHCDVKRCPFAKRTLDINFRPIDWYTCTAGYPYLKEQTKEILQDLKEYIAYESKPFIKWGSDNPQNEIPDACIDSDMLNNKIDEIAKEYGVEL